MKVTFVYRYLTLGGVESVLASRLRALPRLGIHPTLWFLEDGPGRALWETRPPEVRIGDPGALRVHLDEAYPDVVSVIDTPEALAPAASATCRPRLLLEVHTPYPENRLYLRQPEARLASLVLVPSEHQKRIVAHEMRDPPHIVVVPNPIGDSFEAPLETMEGQDAAPVICWVGRLDHLKNWRGFLSIAERVFRQSPRVEAWVVGSGSVDEEADFLRRCEAPALRGRVRWLRGVRPADMPRLLDGVRSSGGVVVSTSRAESFGMAVAEAMARGCAVIVPRVDPFPGFMTHREEGCLYRAGAWGTAADMVVKVMGDESHRIRLGTAARERILSSHGTEVAMSALASVLGSVVPVGPRTLRTGGGKGAGGSALPERREAPAADDVWGLTQTMAPSPNGLA